ncbi:universal stress protein [Blastococcus tunisiensis]|uniref:Nucleotide-binding universal stress protein, UspA family n=1 Tax=Blastococcus tunisiensis TaxID=1798228 RepID=A0A1I2GBL1_9ACTN|nr:universal stress protein [Blastococcus sp. DSM 46838]SFF14509.1 Nucleotide-binding universal stress protein, UspA family [Blastococcus sp. DSM 46838]
MLSDAERRTASQLEADLLSDAAFARSIHPSMSGLQTLSCPVLVGVGNDGAPAAVEWAAAEAAAMGSMLRLVHVVRYPVTPDLFGVVPGDPAAHLHQAAAEILDAAAARARRTSPALEVSACLLPGPASHVLRRESTHARLLVLGAPGPSWTGIRRLVQGSVPSRLTASAHCPVAVIHDGAPADHHDGRPPPVVVGVDGTDRSEAAVAFAFRAARRRHVGVTAVHAWTADHPADLEGMCAPAPTSEACARALTEAVVAPWRALYPDVPVQTEVVPCDPASALILGSPGAALVVVGSRMRGRALGAALPSISRTLLAGAAGPIAIVPRGALAPHRNTPRSR